MKFTKNLSNLEKPQDITISEKGEYNKIVCIEEYQEKN